MNTRAHVWVKLHAMPWSWCPHCGLVRLRNEPTERAARKPCPDA